MPICDYDSGLNNNSYLALFLTGFAFYHRTVINLETKRWLASLIGMFVMVYIMWEHAWHHLLVVLSCIAIIKYVGWRTCHLAAMTYLFTYILIFRLADSTIRYHHRIDVNLQQMLITLKLVGVAFDIHLTNRGKKVSSNDNDKASRWADDEPIDPSYMELFHYVFCYVGMVVGPYVRYRTYDDYLKLPFAKNSKPWNILRDRIMHVFLSVIGCKIISYHYPIEYILTDEFRRRHFLFKNYFNFLQLVRFKMWMTSGLYMAQCVCSIIGVGAYPESLKAESANGPTVNYIHMKNITQEEAEKLSYDFETINTLDLYRIHIAPWHSDFWRYWNRTVQYWMGMYIHKELLGDSILKDYRIVLTMLVSAYWHGIELGFYSSLVLSGLYIVAEKPYHQIYHYTTGWGSSAFLVAMWFIQAHIFSHLMMSFIVLQPSVIMLHSAGMYYAPYISLLIFYVVGKLGFSFLQKECAL